MDNILRIAITIMILSVIQNIYANNDVYLKSVNNNTYFDNENDVYLEDESDSPKYFETSIDNIGKYENNISSRTKTDSSEYDLEVFNYMSVKFKSEKSFKEDYYK